MTTTANNVQTLPSTPKPQTTREVIQANVDLLIEQLEAGHSEALTAYLTAMGRFHNYSLGNIKAAAKNPPGSPSQPKSAAGVVHPAPAPFQKEETCSSSLPD